MSNSLIVNEYFDSETGTFSYLLIDSEAHECVVVDPVLGFDMVSSSISLEPTQEIISKIKQDKLDLKWVLETHAHADHLTSAIQLKQQFGCQIAIGKGITSIQRNFKAIYQFDDDYNTDGSAFDRLLNNGDSISFGNQTIDVLATPGHTSDSLTYRVDKYLFIGDTLFHPKIGSARCDFPGGDAELLFQSIETILAHDDDFIICLCHDYPEDYRKPQTFISVKEMKSNCHWQNSQGQATKFKEIRNKRDELLALPKLIVPSIQVNTQAGIDLTDSERSLKWPINRF